MHRISFITDLGARQEDFRQQFSDVLDIEFRPLKSILDELPKQNSVFDIELSDTEELRTLKEWIGRKPKNGKVIFITDRASRIQGARAYAIGATAVLHRPVDRRTLLTSLRGAASSADDDADGAAADAAEGATPQHPPSVAAATESLNSMFVAASVSAPIDASSVQSAGGVVVGQIEQEGLASWIDAVRLHHSQTYQHCLLVTGVAVAFGRHLGISRADQHRLSFAGMLHDVGKARIPLAILEKPGPLDTNELAVMRKHPEHGLVALAATPSLPAEMLDMVVHHHEYLDGSGYPHGLQANEISDLVRIMTISDIFGALLERRSYKPPLSGEAAYKIMLDMSARLDKDLLREFKFASKIANP